MNLRRGRIFRRVLIGMGLLAGLAVSTMPTGASVADVAERRANVAGTGVVVRLDEFVPSAPVAGQKIRIRGTFTTTNPAGTNALYVRVRLLAPLAGRSDVSTALDSTVPRAGTVVANSLVAAASNSGDVIPWTVIVPVDSLNLGGAAVYPIEIDAVTSGQTWGATRTLLPWFPHGTPMAKLGVTLVWPISAIPNVNALGVYGDESLPQSMGTDGRLDILSSAAQQTPGLSPVIDPFLLQAAKSGATGYQVADPANPANTVAGTNVDAMAAWLAKTESAVRSHAAALLPYASVDTGQMLNAHQGALVTRSLRSATRVASDVLGQLATEPRVVVPATGYLSKFQAQQLVHDGVQAMVVSSAMLPTVPTLNYTSSGRADMKTGSGIAHFVLADDALSTVVSHANAANSVLLRQRLLGETLLIALELPSAPRTIAVSPFGLFSPTAATAQAVIDGLVVTRWTTPVSLPDFIAAQPPTVAHHFVTPTEVAGQPQLSQGQVKSIVASNSPLKDLATVIAPSSQYLNTMEDGQMRAASQTWRTEPAEGRLFAASYHADVTAARNSVSVRVPTTVVIPGQSGVLPVTIVNDLPTAVTVRVSVVGVPSFRITTKANSPVAVDPNHRHSLEVPITVFGSGALDVDVRLTSVDGRTITDPMYVQIQSSAYSRVAAIVAGLAFLVLLGLSIASITRRVRNRGKDDA